MFDVFFSYFIVLQIFIIFFSDLLDSYVKVLDKVFDVSGVNQLKVALKFKQIWEAVNRVENWAMNSISIHPLIMLQLSLKHKDILKILQVPITQIIQIMEVLI